MDVRRILQIPLNLGAFDDFIAWNPDSKGYFSVKTAYKIQWAHSVQARANVMAHPSGSDTPEVWSLLWKVNVPRKVHIFAGASCME